MILNYRRQDSSIGFGAPVRANMRSGGLTESLLTSSLLESVRKPLYVDIFPASLLFYWTLFTHLSGKPVPMPCARKSIFFFLKWLWKNCSFQVESGDLMTYGLIPEFIGRFPILVSLSALNEDQLVQVHYDLVYLQCSFLS